MGRNPEGVYHEEDLVLALRDAIRGGRDLYVRENADAPPHKLGPGSEKGTVRFTP